MTQTRDERYWENEGWRVLCRQTVNLCINQSESLLDAAAAHQAVPPSAVDEFIDACVRALGRRAGTDTSGLWQTALSLFGDVAGLRGRLINDPALAKNSRAHSAVAPQQALYQRLRDHLNDRRREISPNRENVWRRLDGISRRLARGVYGRGRCNDEHFSALTAYLREHHAGDHNLPRTYATVEAYFLEFCPDCRRERGVDHELLGADDLDMFQQDNELDVGLSLQYCLERLQQQDGVLYDIIDAGYRLSEVTPLSKESVRSTHGLSRREFERREQQALTALRQCVENQLTGSAR